MRLTFLAFFLCLTLAAGAQQRGMPPSAIPLNTPRGERLLLTSADREAYWHLSIHHETQINNAFCGPASACMVLNALQLPAPASVTHPPFHAFEQDIFFSPATDAILSQATCLRRGATLQQLAGLIEANGARVEFFHAEPGGLEAFRKRARAAAREGACVVINFKREPLGQESGGHFSPLGAYHAPTDRFLVLDVARFHYPPWWIPAADIFRAMQTPDSDSGKNRGYLIARRPPR